MRSDWGLYESWRKSFQHKHADMLSDYTHTKSQSCQWIKRGEPIEIDGFLLKRGCFYVGDCFQIPKSYKEKCLNYENIKENDNNENVALVVDENEKNEIIIDELIYKALL